MILGLLNIASLPENHSRNRRTKNPSCSSRRRTTKPIQSQISRMYGKWRQCNDVL